MRTKKRRKLASEQRGPVQSAVRANQRWSMDFITDRLENGRYLRTLTVVDQIFARSARSWKRPTHSDSGEGRRCARYRGSQARLSRIDHRGQRQRVLQPYAGCVGLPSRREAGLHSARQAGGERIYRELQRATAGRMPQRRVVLVGVEDARAKLEKWRVDYNVHRPHSSLANLPPAAFANELRQRKPTTNRELLTVGNSS